MLALLISLYVVGSAGASLWPLPEDVSLGRERLFLPKDFRFLLSGDAEGSQVLASATARYQKLISFGHGEVLNNDVEKGAPEALESCQINVEKVISDPEAEKNSLQLGVNEKYELMVSTGTSPTAGCTISAPTVWGALRAMETFTQLLVREGFGSGHRVELSSAPVSISDAPAYSHRGVMIDTSRHYLGVSVIERAIDAAAMNKMSVLHWHAVDAESFPLVTPSSPQLSDGAYSRTAVYSMDDVRHLVDYGTDRGVRIILEVNSPGHAASWTKGYPQIMAKCFRKYSYNYNDFAVNPTLEKTYEVVEGAYQDVLGATRDGYMHLGGDEVVYGCWDDDAGIVEYKEANGIESDDALYGMYVSRVGGIAGGLGATPIHWQEAFIAYDRSVGDDKMAFKFQPGTAFQVWSGDGDLIHDITAANFSCVASPNAYWYMDHPTSTWDVMYYYDPASGLSSSQRSLVLGGEAVMFGELVDEGNFDASTQPKAAAVAERLWSDRQAQPDDPAVGPRYDEDMDEVRARLMDHRCRMRNRGINAAPIAPDYCSTNFV